MCIAGFFSSFALCLGVADCVVCKLVASMVASWCCFRGLRSGLGFIGTIIDDAFLVGDRRRGCEVGMGMSGFLLKDFGLDGRGVEDSEVDKVG
jgi:hypothetical protein